MEALIHYTSLNGKPRYFRKLFILSFPNLKGEFKLRYYVKLFLLVDLLTSMEFHGLIGILIKVDFHLNKILIHNLNYIRKWDFIVSISLTL